MLISLDFPSGSPGLYGTQKARMTEGLYAQIGHTYTVDTAPVDIVADPDGVSGGNVFICYQNGYGGGSNRVTMREVLPAGATQTVTAACRLYLSALPANNEQIPLPVIWKDGANNSLAEIRITSTGAIEAWKGPVFNATFLGTSGTPVTTANAWTHFECRIKCSTTGTGEITVWVEGQQVLALTGLSFDAATCSQIERGVDPSSNSANPAVYFKDTVLADNTGTANNAQIGPLLVMDLNVNADITTGWTSTGANNFSVVDESPPDDLDFVSAVTPPPAPSVMGLADLPPDIVGVRGLVSYARARKVDSGDGTINIGLTPNGVDYDNGTDKVLTTAASYYRDVSELSPVSGTAWTPVEVNNAYVRLNRIL